MTNPSPTRTARTEQHIRMLAELADLTMVLCRVASLRACEQLDPAAATAPQPEPTPNEHPAAEPPGDSEAHTSKTIGQDAVLAFARLSRSLRQTIALEVRVAADHDRKTAARDANIVWRPIPPLPNEIAKAHLADVVLAAANAAATIKTARTPGPQTLLRHIDERLDADDIAESIEHDDDLAAIVAKVCRDLDIDFDPNDHPGDLQRPLREAIEASRTRRSPAEPPRDRPEPRFPTFAEDEPPKPGHVQDADDPGSPSRPPRTFDA